MKGHPEVISELNRLLAGELAAMDQYFIHSRMYANWGLTKLAERISHEMQDETSHADLLIQRILFLDGTPNMMTRDPLRVGHDVPSMLENDLEVELSVVDGLKSAIELCEVNGDYQTRSILEVMLKDTEEDHTHWLEKQIGLIGRIGLHNYLQSQM
ncbi:MAG: bacterioferritin [Pseudomonadota bacterium]|jgi:bacterioferritin